MTFFHEGGVAMWLTLILFLGFGAAAVARRGRDGDRLALVGAVATITSGLLGMSTGLYNTVAYAAGVASADRAEILGIGIRESVHNTTFAALLGFTLAILGLGLGYVRREGSTSPAVGD